MISARELRIGNLVYLYDEICVVNSIHEYGTLRLTPINRHDLDWKYESFNLEQTPQLKPIQLTEEILLKCGFEKVSHGRFSHKTSLFTVKLGLKRLGYPYMLCHYTNYPKPCNYLHQLQNLYFALTGEELKIEI